MSVESKTVETLTAPAPHEQTVATPVGAVTHIITISFKRERFSGTFLDWIASSVRNCGSVKLISVYGVFHPSESGQYIKAGVTEAGSSVPIDTLCLKRNGFIFTANAYNVGKTVDFTIVPENTLSRQIKPNSADLPVPFLLVEKSEGGVLNIVFEIAVIGVQQLYVDMVGVASGKGK